MEDRIKRYRRATHDSGGRYRHECDELWDKIPGGFRGVVHYLDSREWMSEHDILVEVFKYASDDPQCNDVALCVIPGLLQDTLELLANFGMVEMIEAQHGSQLP